MNEARRDQRYPDVAIVGVGNMGLPVAGRLLDAARAEGARLHVHARTPARIAELVARGAVPAGTPRELAAADVVLSFLPDLPELEELLWGEDGIVAGVAKPLVLLIGSTSSPEGVRALAARLAAATDGLVRVVDCPVSGGTEGAAAGELAIMVGGDPADVDRAMPVLRSFGVPVHLGPLGAGEVAKACNQAIVAATTLALSEAAVLAERSGLDVAALFELLGRGYAGSRILDTRGTRIVDRDYRVAGPARYMVKDLGFALDEARRTATALPQTAAAHAAFAALTREGLGDQDLAVARAYIESLRPDAAAEGEPGRVP